MCLWSKTGTMLRAKEDIVAYKIFKIAPTGFKETNLEEFTLFSPYMNYKYSKVKDGAMYESGAFGLDIPKEYTGLGYPIVYGFHSYAKEEDADDTLKILLENGISQYFKVKVIIRKGTLYFHGYDDSGAECYCSELIELKLGYK